MRKPATILLLTGLLVPMCSLWAQQSPTQQGPTQQSPTQQNPSNSQSQSEPTTTLRVDVNLVNVFVTVTDAHGAPIGGLTKENFILKEDDQEQKISVFDRESALPISIALAIDTSLSTRHDLPLEQTSAKKFAHAILRPIDALSVYGFSASTKPSITFASVPLPRSTTRFMWPRALWTAARGERSWS
jgi:Ca-activated chloride channel family protein